MFDSLIKRYNTFRKEQLLHNPLFATKKKYAFIGVGMHSLNNIYPILSHFKIDLKYICTNSGKQYAALYNQFPNCIFINDIQKIIDDVEVEAVFVCANPKSHFNIISRLAKGGKKIFVEKPPCQTLEELKKLIDINPLDVCKVGFQRRYWPGNNHFIKKCSSAHSYSYKFLFGVYINNDVLTELFIHAIDYCIFIFGNFSISSFSKHEYDKGITIQIHAKHENGISGLIELSTHFSWNAPVDLFTINCKNEILTVQYPTNISGRKKPARLLNMPTERVFKQPEIIKEYFSAGNFIMPVNEMNTLVLQGFYAELQNFILLVEHNAKNANDLPALITLYDLLEKLKNG